MSYGDERGRVATRVVGLVQRGLLRQAVAVLNLSTGGAMIEMLNPPREGERLRFECKVTGLVDAHVAWVIGNRCGLRFEYGAAPNRSAGDLPKKSIASQGAQTSTGSLPKLSPV